ncbi:MAG: hypothetical protein K2X76_10695 [Sphingomonas sp.]|nr:hypothetical protein [Sphingomonas sp.]
MRRALLTIAAAALTASTPALAAPAQPALEKRVEGRIDTQKKPMIRARGAAQGTTEGGEPKAGGTTPWLPIILGAAAIIGIGVGLGTTGGAPASP